MDWSASDERRKRRVREVKFRRERVFERGRAEVETDG
jgi:hypothetical protein